MAGSRQQLKEFDANFQAEAVQPPSNPVIIIGGGRVGRASAAALKRRGLEYRVVEKLEERVLEPEIYIHGSGGDKSVLQLAGIETAQTVIITTGDDETNIYLTIFVDCFAPISRSSVVQLLRETWQQCIERDVIWRCLMPLWVRMRCLTCCTELTC
jgi:threonine dehydrogenase-like Zn-dependent dehydrogenase